MNADLNKQTVAQLRALAASKGLTRLSKLRKAELIDLILSNDGAVGRVKLPSDQLPFIDGYERPKKTCMANGKPYLLALAKQLGISPNLSNGKVKVKEVLCSEIAARVSLGLAGQPVLQDRQDRPASAARPDSEAWRLPKKNCNANLKADIERAAIRYNISLKRPNGKSKTKAELCQDIELAEKQAAQIDVSLASTLPRPEEQINAANDINPIVAANIAMAIQEPTDKPVADVIEQVVEASIEAGDITSEEGLSILNPENEEIINEVLNVERPALESDDASVQDSGDQTEPERLVPLARQQAIEDLLSEIQRPAQKIGSIQAIQRQVFQSLGLIN